MLFLPTDAPPGTEEKVRAMEERRAAGLPLFHDEDSLDPDCELTGWTPLNCKMSRGVQKANDAAEAAADEFDDF